MLMGTDLPDYEKKIVIVTLPGEYPAIIQVDLRKILGENFITPTIAGCVPTSIEHIIDVNHKQILGVALKTPTIAQCLPISIEHVAQIDHHQIKGLTLKDPTVALSVPVSWEGPYLAYEPCLDAWKVQLLDLVAGVLPVSLADDWARQLGLVDLSRVLGAALSVTNPVIARLSNGTIAIDPRDRNWTITESLARSWNLGETDIPDLLDKAARLLGIIYGDKGQLAQRTTSKDLFVQLRSAGSEIDPTQIRALTVADIITAKQSDETLLKATVTQAAKDRTISSIDATATALQISIAALNGNSSALVTPASGKAIRIKFISLEHSADVDLGYRFAAAGTIYYLRTTAGVYVSNLIGCNNQGAADEALYLNSSAATNVKGYILYSEV